MFGNGIPAIAEIGPINFLFGNYLAASFKRCLRYWRNGAREPLRYGRCVSDRSSTGHPVCSVPRMFLVATAWRVSLKTECSFWPASLRLCTAFFGLVVLVPFIRSNIGGTGQSILCASLVLGVMILPTIITLSESALRAVPRSYYEGAFGFRC